MKVKLISLLTVLISLSAIHATAQSTEFTYQGRLLSGEVPANGAHDFEFLLWDEITAGTQIGSTVTLTNVNVNNGVFSVRIDFGNQFPGANRFLEIKVRQSGTGSPFSSLAPRQAISSAPYAIKSLNAENASSAQSAVNSNRLGGISANNYVVTNDPRMTDARQPLPNSPNYIQNSETVQAPSNFNVSGTGTASVLNATTRFDIGGQRILLAPGSSNVFVGRSAGSESVVGQNNSFFGSSAGALITTGAGNSFFGQAAGEANMTGSANSFFGLNAGSGNTSGFENSFLGAFTGVTNSGNSNSFVGMQAGRTNTSGSGNSFFGRGAGISNASGSNNTILGSSADVGVEGLTNVTALGSRALVTQSNSIVLGSIIGVNGSTAETRVGIGTTAPAAKLTVVGRGVYTDARAARFDLFNTVADAGYSQHVTDAGQWQLATAFGPPKMVLDPSGNVGIGTTAPESARLKVAGSSNAVATPIALLQSSGNQIPLAFSSSGTEVARVRADSSGNLVFATVSGSSKDIYFRAGDDSSTPRLFIDGTTGRVGIGTTSPGSNLSVTGSVSISNQLSIGNLDGSSSNHLCRSDVNLVAACTSSIRYKTNVNTLTSGMDLIRKLRPVTFNWKRNNAPEIGLIAEEVATVEPRLTFNNQDGEIEGVNYDSVGVVLVNAVNEQQSEIEAQRERIRKLESQIDLLTRILCAQNPSAEVCGPKN